MLPSPLMTLPLDVRPIAREAHSIGKRNSLGLAPQTVWRPDPTRVAAGTSAPVGAVANCMRQEFRLGGLPMRLLAAFACAVMLIWLGAMPSHAERRVALVIGNGDYAHADKLANPVTDARRLKEALVKLGFETVYGENLGKQALERTIGRFANTAQGSEVALVFYAGH